MRKGAKRKTKHAEESKPDSEPTPTATASSQENDNQITKPQPKPKRQKTSKPQSEPEYFEDKRNLVRSSTFIHTLLILL
jgi:hypothetical protein